MEPIETAPKDGKIIHICNPKHDVGLVASWNNDTRQWEGKIFGVMRTINVRWDRDDPIQPTHWNAVDNE